MKKPFLSFEEFVACVSKNKTWSLITCETWVEARNKSCGSQYRNDRLTVHPEGIALERTTPGHFLVVREAFA